MIYWLWGFQETPKIGTKNNWRSRWDVTCFGHQVVVLHLFKTNHVTFTWSIVTSITSSYDLRYFFFASVRDHFSDTTLFRDSKNSCLRDALKAKQKELKEQGRGNKPNAASALSDEEIYILLGKKKCLGNNFSTITTEHCMAEYHALRA